MAAYELNILEIAAEKLYARGKGLQSPELRYEEAAFLKWLQDNIKLDELIHVLFKQACLANGVKPGDYNKYFAENNIEILNYILQEDVLKQIGIKLIQKQPPEDSLLCFQLQTQFNLSEKDAKEIIIICAKALEKGYAPAIADAPFRSFFETARNDFLKIRNSLYYNIALKETDRVQSELTGSIITDLKRSLETIILTIELAFYDLSSFWNKEITFFIDGTPQKNILPEALYNYYVKLKHLLELAHRSNNPSQYEKEFISTIAPFFETLSEEKTKEENSFFTKNLSHHYQWHLLGLDFLRHLPKQIHQAAKSEGSKEDAQSSAASAPPPPPSGDAPKIIPDKGYAPKKRKESSSGVRSENEMTFEKQLRQKIEGRAKQIEELEAKLLKQDINQENSASASSSDEKKFDVGITQSSSISNSSSSSSEKPEKVAGKKAMPSQSLTWLTVSNTMPEDTSKIRNGYLLIRTPKKILYSILAGALTPVDIKNEVSLENMLRPAVKSRLDRLEKEYSVDWIETPELWQNLTIKPENKNIALAVIKNKLQCKVRLLNGNVIEFMLGTEYSEENLTRIKGLPQIVLPEILDKIKMENLLFPISLTPPEMQGLQQSIGQSIESAPKLPNKMSFHASSVQSNIKRQPMEHRRSSIQLPPVKEGEEQSASENRDTTPLATPTSP